MKKTLVMLSFATVAFTMVGCGSANMAAKPEVSKAPTQLRDGIRFNVVEGNKEAAYNDMIKNKISAAGFKLSDPHERINDAYAKKYGGTNLDNLGFFSITNDKALRPLLLKDPSIGGFSPFNEVIYKLKDENKTYVGHVDPEVMLDIVGAKDKAVRDGFKAMFPKLDDVVQKDIGGEVKYHKFSTLATKRMIRFEIPIDREEDLTDIVEGFQDKFETAFEDSHFIIAGFKDFKNAYANLGLPFDRYDAYFVYSLCHFTFSESIFNRNDKATVDGRPDAGAFAPCSMYMYIEKGGDKIEIGMPTLENWIAVMGIKDPAKVKEIRALDKEIVEIMKNLGGKEI